MAAVLFPIVGADDLRESPVEFDGDVSLDTWWISEVAVTDSPVFGEAGVAVSPWGRSCGDLPSTEWVMRWIEDLEPLADPSFTPYSSDYPLADPVPAYMSWGITEELWAAGREFYPSVEWAGTMNSQLTEAAAALLGSTVSKEIVEALRGPLGFLGRRLVMEPSPLLGLEETLRLPLLDPTTTPMRRAIRRLLPLFLQKAQAALERPAIDVPAQEALDGFVQKIEDYLGVALVSPQLRYEDIDDRAYVPVIGAVSAASPLYNGLWRPGGLAGPVVSLLMPSRADPRIASLPQNWAVNNLAEFLPTLMPFLLTVQGVLAGRGISLESFLDTFGVDGTAVVEAMDYYKTNDGSLLSMSPELGALVFGDLLEGLRELRDGVGSGLDLGSAKKSLIGIGGWLLMGPLLGLFIAFHGVAEVERITTEVLDELRGALDQLIDGIGAATAEGVAFNDALAMVMMAFGTALEQLRAVRLLYTDLGDLARVKEHAEEGLLMGLGSEDFHALQMGLFGVWFGQYLDSRLPSTATEGTYVGLTEVAEILGTIRSGFHRDLAAAVVKPNSGATSVFPAVSGTVWEAISEDALVANIEDLRALHDELVPVWMVEADRASWPFETYESWSWYRYVEPVDGFDISVWVELSSPLVQLVLAIDTASALLEAGVQAESMVCGFSGLATGNDSMGQQTRAGFAAVDMGRIDMVLSGVSISRFAATMWRQAMIDRLLLDLASSIFDSGAIYEIVRWMRTDTRRGHLDTLLGPLDSERGGRRYEEGLVGRLGGFDGETWLFKGSLDEAWLSLTAEERETWVEALPTLVDRESMQSLVDAVDAARGADGTPEEPTVVSEFDSGSFVSPLDFTIEPGFHSAVAERVSELEGFFFGVDELLGFDGVLVGPFLPTWDLDLSERHFNATTVRKLVGPIVEVVTTGSWTWATSATSRTWRTA